VVVFASGHADTVCLDLEAKASLIFPERGSHSRFHPRRCDLSSDIEC